MNQLEAGEKASQIARYSEVKRRLWNAKAGAPPMPIQLPLVKAEFSKPARDWLLVSDKFTKEFVIPAVPTDILRKVADAHGLHPDEILSPRRSRKHIKARHMAICMANAMFPKLSLPKLGKIFNRDHSSVLHALNKAKRDGVAQSPEYLTIFMAVKSNGSH